ncbi:MAG TPA: SpoIIE family protein phosphatase [Terracidiphilus sp.]|nr:SpoIIE family protein phosphatase [Terracidiphilus sp.]
MMIVGRAAQFCKRSILRWRPFLRALIVVLALAPAWGQARAQAPAANNTAANPIPAGMHAIVQLDGPWRFQVGDDPRWADPAFDDSGWPNVTLDKSLSDQGFDTYAGYAWYRLRVQPHQLRVGDMAGNTPLNLLVTSHSVGQLAVYINGVEVAHTRGMTDSPQMYESAPLQLALSQSGGGDTVMVAVRTWAAPGVPITHGLLEKVEAGSQVDIAERMALAISRKWNQEVIAEMSLTFLFLGVGMLGIILYMAQRHHSEYLWLALMCFSVTITGSVALAHWLALISTSTFDLLNLWAGRIFMVVTLEFVLRFAGTERRHYVRYFQGFVLIFPLLSVLGLQQTYQVLSISAEIAFCVFVCALLLRSWRRGFREAGILLVPFFLAATADSIDTVLDYMAGKHWISEGMAIHKVHLGPIEISLGLITYGVFLSSLIAVILYRFVRVSQDEQRSTAEIAAARSVQAMLIPTQLPSNSYFMLESAYVPANGVGGDFFQVLPVEDGSMLIVVGDVSGKGLQAAMNASTLVGAFRNELSHDPATILNHLNHVMFGSGYGLDAVVAKDSVATFATCLCARIYRNGKMEIANAGHLSPYRDGREVELPPGLPLGVIPGMTYEQTTFQLDQGDRIIFLSDGVVEATNADGELFGFERTQQVSNEPARYIAQTARRFGQNDDITVISIYVASRDARHSDKLEPAFNR